MTIKSVLTLSAAAVILFSGAQIAKAADVSTNTTASTEVTAPTPAQDKMATKTKMAAHKTKHRAHKTMKKVEKNTDGSKTEVKTDATTSTSGQ